MAALIQSGKGTAKNDQALTEAIAKDTETSVELVKEIYEQELTTLSTDAKITQYLGVIAGRRVRMKLKSSETEKH